MVGKQSQVGEYLIYPQLKNLLMWVVVNKRDKH